MQIKFLGTGAAEGIPAMNCDCPHCRRAVQEGGKLVRERTAILLSLPGYELLVDTPPDIRQLLEKNRVKKLDGIFLTHAHHDHSGGLEDFRYWREGIDLFAVAAVYEALKREQWDEELNDVLFHCPCRPGMAIRFDGFFFTPFPVHHSAPCFGLAYYQGSHKVVHASDTDRRFSNYARTLIAGADILIVNTPRFQPPHDNHITLTEAVNLREELAVQHLVLTHINHHNQPHDELEAYVEQFEGVSVAYDGLVLSL